jgi:hypothetical protein
MLEESTGTTFVAVSPNMIGMATCGRVDTRPEIEVPEQLAEALGVSETLALVSQPAQGRLAYTRLGLDHEFAPESLNRALEDRHAAI